MRSKLRSVDAGRMVAFVRGFTGGRQVVADEPVAEGGVRAGAPQPLSPWERAPEGRVRASAQPDARGDEGLRLFQHFCLRCHGADGRGSGMRESLPSLPDFTRHAWQQDRSDPQMLASVLGGKGTGMPSFGNRLGREQARSLVAYIRGFAPLRTGLARTATDDWEVRFEQLEHELEELRRQFHALSEPPRQP
jgi:mono/diheme cytochrome c family protein